MYVTDTHSLVYYSGQQFSRLGRNARRLFNSADENETLIYIPTVVLWEVTQRIAGGALALPMPFDRWCRAFDSTTGFLIAPLEWQDIDQARTFSFKDPFDRLIAGTALRLGVPLITKNREICDSGLVETTW